MNPRQRLTAAVRSAATRVRAGVGTVKARTQAAVAALGHRARRLVPRLVPLHREKLTMPVEVNVPVHPLRVTTALFERTRPQLLAREGQVCWICGRTAAETGHPLEAHHHPVERSLAEMIDWPRFAADCQAGVWGPYAQAFDWATFLGAQPFDPYVFVDDMTVNGLPLCKDHHTGYDQGIHCLPYPLWLPQKYGKEGYRFSDVELIHHPDQEPLP